MMLLVLWCVQHLKLAEINTAISRAAREREQSAARGKETDAHLKSLRAQTSPAIGAVTVAPVKDIPLENAIASWIARVRLLSTYASKYPEWRIRQMDLLTDDDWLSATRGKLESEADFLKALGSLRWWARKKTATEIGSALKAALAGGLTLASPRDLLPYLPTGFDPAILDQMQLNVPVNGQSPLAPSTYLLVDRPVNRWDPYFMFDANGNWGARSNTPSEHYTISNAIRDYTKAHGSPPNEFSQLKNYSDVNRFNEQNAKEVFGALMTRPEP